VAARSVLSQKHLGHCFRAAPTLLIQHTVSNISNYGAEKITVI